MLNEFTCWMLIDLGWRYFYALGVRPKAMIHDSYTKSPPPKHPMVSYDMGEGVGDLGLVGETVIPHVHYQGLSIFCVGNSP